jgi:hypothetical protein
VSCSWDQADAYLVRPRLSSEVLILGGWEGGHSRDGSRLKTPCMTEDSLCFCVVPDVLGAVLP